MNKKKAIISNLLICAFAVATLSGCSCNHVWEEATCTAPKTCTECGETEGETLPHSFSEANYQQAATCIDCGLVEGEPLKNYLEENGIAFNVTSVDTKHDYVTCVQKNADIVTNGKFYVSNYTITTDDASHENIDGYEWRSVDIHFEFNDDAAWKHGTQFSLFCLDATDIHDDGGEEGGLFTVNMNGKDFDQCMILCENASSGWEDRQLNVSATVLCRVPVGYSEMVVGAYNGKISLAGNATPEVYLNDADTLLFNLS